MNNGQCLLTGKEIRCQCPPGFTGQKCESRDPCEPNPVQSSLKCSWLL